MGVLGIVSTDYLGDPIDGSGLIRNVSAIFTCNEYVYFPQKGRSSYRIIVSSL
jgi:hypothetical protein